MIDPRKIKSIINSGKYTINANLIGLTQNVFMKDSDAINLVASGDITTADLILAYNEERQRLTKYNHLTSSWDRIDSFDAIREFDSENALRDMAELDSEGYKVKERFYVDKNRKRILTWDSDLDNYVSLSGFENPHQDFLLTTKTNPYLTITEPKLLEIEDSDLFYVSYQGMPLPPNGYTILGEKGNWRFQLYGDSDYAGSTFELNDWIRIGIVETIGQVVFKQPLTKNFIGTVKKAWHMGAKTKITNVTQVDRYNVNIDLEYEGQPLTATSTISETFSTSFNWSQAFSESSTFNQDFSGNGSGDMWFEIVFDRPVRLHEIAFRGKVNYNEYFTKARLVGWESPTATAIGDAVVVSPESAVNNQTFYHSILSNPNTPIQKVRVDLYGGFGTNCGLHNVSIRLADEKIEIPWDTHALYRTDSRQHRYATTLAYNVRGISHLQSDHPNSSNNIKMTLLEPVTYHKRTAIAQTMNDPDYGWGSIMLEVNNASDTFEDSDKDNYIWWRPITNAGSATTEQSFQAIVTSYDESTYDDEMNKLAWQSVDSEVTNRFIAIEDKIGYSSYDILSSTATTIHSYALSENNGCKYIITAKGSVGNGSPVHGQEVMAVSGGGGSSIVEYGKATDGADLFTLAIQESGGAANLVLTPLSVPLYVRVHKVLM